MDNNIAILNSEIYQTIYNTLTYARAQACRTINDAIVKAYWEIGRQINEEVGQRAGYGKQLLKYLSERLTEEFGKGFTIRNLQVMRQFYSAFPKAHTLRAELSWSHYRLLIRVAEPKRREFYLQEAADANWSTRQLERQINSCYYERLLITRKNSQEDALNEMRQPALTTTPDYLFKDPYVLEFLGLKEDCRYQESEVEQALIDHLQEFLLELGKGFSFVARQKRITLSGDNYYPDLIFYNYKLKCFVVVDLKVGKLSYQDIGQIDFYVRYYDDKIKNEDDNPTIGILLCAEKNDAMAKYSVLSDKDQLFASKYQFYLPTEEELKRELLREREQIEAALQAV